MFDEQRHAPRGDDGSSSRRVGIAGAFTGVLTLAMIMRGSSAETAVISGAIVFGSIYLAEVVSHSPVLIAWLDYKARVDPYRQQYTAQPRYGMVGERESVEGPQTLPMPSMPQLPTFVPAVDDGVRREAMAWLLGLYDASGQLDAKKVLLTTQKEQPGRVRVAAPGKAAIQYLLDRRILHALHHTDGTPTGYRVNLRYLERDSVNSLVQ